MENKLSIIAGLDRCGIIPGLQYTEKGCVESNQIFGLIFDDRDIIYNHLIKNGVEAKQYFYPACHNQDFYARNYIHPDFPVTEEISQKIICLPMDADLTQTEIKYMIEKISEIV